MATSLAKDPVYLQFDRVLRELILSDQISLGDRFPTERQVKHIDIQDKELTR